MGNEKFDPAMAEDAEVEEDVQKLKKEKNEEKIRREQDAEGRN